MTTPPNDAGDDLRALLHDTVSEVHPSEALQEIQARTRGTQTTPTRWLPLTIAAAAAVIAVLGGVAWFANVTADNGRVAGPDGPRVERDREPGRNTQLQVFYVGDTAIGPKLFSETRVFTDVRGTDLETAVQAAIGSPPRDRDYTAWTPSDGLIAQAVLEGDALTIDISEQLQRPAGMSDRKAAAMLQALVTTAQVAAETESPVQFTVEGRQVDSLLGIDTRDPVPVAPFDTLAPMVSISSPAEGDVVGSGFQVEGMANANEANVVWELRQGDTVVRKGFTTAAECCTWSPFRFDVEAPPGEYTLAVQETDDSDNEGFRISEDTKDIIIR